MTIIFGNGQDGTVTISSTTDVGSTNLKQFVSLTVDATFTYSGNSGFAIYVQKTLTLNGTIASNNNVDNGGNGATSGGNGGEGGGSVFIFARVPAGSGKITANATNGANGVAGGANASGNDGGVAVVEGATSPTVAKGGQQAAAAQNAGGAFSVDEVARRIRALIALGQVSRYRINGGGGGEGGGSAGTGGDGGGGGSFVDSGGNSGAGDGSNRPGGGGGGAAGCVVTVSYGVVDWDIDCIGGNGGNASIGNGGGGGGAGGLAAIICGRYTGIVTLTAGSAGTGAVVGNNGRFFLWDIRSVR